MAQNKPIVRVVTRKLGEIPGCVRESLNEEEELLRKVAHLPIEYRQGAIEELKALRRAPAGLLGLPSKR